MSDTDVTAIAVREATELSTLCTDLAYVTAEDRDQANRALREIKRVAAALDEREKEITRPLRAGLDSARALFSAPRLLLETAEAEVKAGILAGLHAEEDAVQRAAQAAMDMGDAETATAIVATAPAAPEGFQIRRTTRAQVTNPGIVPHRLLMDARVLKAIEQAALPELRQGATIPGVRLVYSTSVASKGP